MAKLFYVIFSNVFNNVINIVNNVVNIITARQRTLREGNVFTGMCFSVRGGG